MGGKQKNKKTEGENKERQIETDRDRDTEMGNHGDKERNTSRQTDRETGGKTAREQGEKRWVGMRPVYRKALEQSLTSRRDCCVGVPILILIFASPRG